VPIPLHHRFLQVSALLVGCAVMPIDGYAQTAFQSHQVAQSPNVLQIGAHGDFNNDGREDLMVNRFNTSGSVTGLLYLSTDNGTYQAPVTLPRAVSAGFTAIGDFNGDGKLDFVASGPTGSQVSVYLGNGNGTFQPAKILSDSTYSSEFCDGIVAADMNHDGKTDLVEIILVPG